MYCLKPALRRVCLAGPQQRADTRFELIQGLRNEGYRRESSLVTL